MKHLKSIKLISTINEATERSSMNILPIGGGFCKIIFIDDNGEKIESGFSAPEGNALIDVVNESDVVLREGNVYSKIQLDALLLDINNKLSSDDASLNTIQKIANYIKSVLVGWSEQSTYEEDGDRIVRKITGYFGGVGTLPTELSDNIGKYYGKLGGFTAVKEDATDFKAEFDGYQNTDLAEITSWSYPFKNIPSDALQQKVALAIKELYIKNYDPAFKYYFIQLTKDVDLSGLGYANHQFFIHVQKVNPLTDTVVGDYRMEFANDDISKLSEVLTINNDFFSIVMDWSKFPTNTRFDENWNATNELSENVGKKEFSPTIFSLDKKQVNNNLNTYLFGAGKNVNYDEDSINNLGIGRNAMENITTARENLAIGVNAMKSHQTGEGNVAIGNDAMRDSTGCIDNTIIGWEAGMMAVTGIGDTAVGRLALSNAEVSAGNTGIGDSAFRYLKPNIGTSKGVYNCGLGYTVADAGIDLSYSVFIGFACARNLLHGDFNVFVGSGVMFNSTLESNGNVGIGTDSLYNVEGDYNVTLGQASLQNVVGNFNLSLGAYAGNGLTLGDSNIFIGSNTSSPATCNNSIAIGSGVEVTKSNQIIIGNAQQEEIIICGVEFTKTQLTALKALL